MRPFIKLTISPPPQGAVISHYIFSLSYTVPSSILSFFHFIIISHFIKSYYKILFTVQTYLSYDKSCRPLRGPQLFRHFFHYPIWYYQVYHHTNLMRFLEPAEKSKSVRLKIKKSFMK